MTESRDDILLAHEFETIFTGYYSAVKYFAFMLLKSEADAEDITQDVFTKLWTQPQIWSDRDSTEISNYIFAMTKHITINFIKHKRIVEEYQESVIEKASSKNFSKQITHSNLSIIKKQSYWYVWF